MSHINVVRQPDGSYTGFELLDAWPHTVLGVTPHFERQFANCLPRPVSAAVAAPRSSAAIRSQLMASELLPSGNYFVGSVSGNAYSTGIAPIVFDVYDPQMRLISETSFTAPSPSGSFLNLGLADVNGDGKPDLIALSIGGSQTSGESFLSVGYLWVFLANGDGTFQPGVSYNLPGSFFGTSYSSFAVGDFSGDGKADLAITTGNGVITVAKGNGDGTFSIGNPTSGLALDGSGPGYIAAADLNGDGKLDVVFGFSGPSSTVQTVFVALGNGDGTFQTPTSIPARLNVPALGDNQITLGDVNGDGVPDIVTAGGTILFGDGKGGFRSERDYAWNATGSVTLADFDGDGVTDILVGNGDGLLMSGSANFPTMTVMFGQGSGKFVGAPISTTGPLAYAGNQATAAADFNGDGIPDLAAVGGGPESLDILKGAGDGTFSLAYRYSFADAKTPPLSMTIADFNRDGKPDVAVLTGVTPFPPMQGIIQVFLGVGDGTLQAPISLALPAPNPTFIGTGDFNGDGIPDLAATAQGDVWVWLGKGDGTFAAPATYPFAGAALMSLAIGDFNRDGKLDIAVANSAAASVAMLLGKGDGTFVMGPVTTISAPPTATGVTVGPFALTTGDFNNDGRLDLASTLGAQAGLLGSGFAVLLGKGDGSFQPLPVDPESAGSIAAADINGDKILDIVVTGSYPPVPGGTPSTVIRIGNGDGTFLPAFSVLTGPFGPPAIADFNLDGKVDIAGGISTAAVYGPPAVATLLNLSTPPAMLAVTSAASYLPGPFAPDEIVSAFGVDLATAASAASTVLVHDSAGATSSAQLYYASSRQVNFVIPASTAIGPATVTVISPAGAESSGAIQITPIAPALSTEGTQGIAAAYAIRVAPDNSQTILPVFAVQGTSVSLTPIDLTQPGSVYLILFGTGFDAASAASTSVNIGGLNVPVQYAGPQLSFAGLDQIGVLLPPSLAGLGVTKVQVTIGGKTANPVYIWL